MNKYMGMAISEARRNIVTGDGGPFGAVIVKNEEVVGRGRNAVFATKDPTCHAEIMAIRDACKNLRTYDLSGCELYASSQPCLMCLSALFWSNIREIYYSTSSSQAAAYGFRGHLLGQGEQSSTALGSIRSVCIDNAEGLALLNDWQKNGQAKYY